MALLRKLQITGIRSFGSDDADAQQVIFGTPFTLILGRNGCGKTTIIEALKYACTGAMPHGQGTNFVRDPKLDGKIETHAQVRLAFGSCNLKDVMIQRSMQVIQKARKMEFKTLDVTAQIKDENGKWKDLSSRCADMDDLMCRMLGVSKPILNYVIFCHQEDSHWPLDEGKKVKERFDEIFDSSKYNKCMIAIRKVRQNTLSVIKTAKEEIKHLQVNVDLAKQKRGELERISKRYNDTKAEMEEFIKEIAHHENEYETWMAKWQSYRKVEKEKESAEMEYRNCLDQQKTLEGLISYRFDGTEDELHDVIKNFDDQLDEKKRAFECILKDIEKLKCQEKSLLKEISHVQNEIGMLKSDMKHEQQQKEQRNLKLSALAKAFGHPALNKEATEDDVIELSNNIRSELKKLLSQISSLKLKNDEELSVLQDNINKCLELKNKLQTEISVKKEAIINNDGDIKSLKDKLKEVTRNVERKRKIDEEVDRYRQEHEKAVKMEDPEDLSNKIADLQEVCKRLEKRQKELTDEVMVLTKYQEAQRELQKNEEKFSEIQNATRRLRAKNGAFFEHHLKDSNDNTLKHDLEMLLLKFKREIDQLKKQANEKNHEVTSLEQRRIHKKDQLRCKEDELKAHEESLFQLCGRKDLDDVLKSVETEINNIQDDRGVIKSSVVVYTHYGKELRRPNSCCPLCHRNFKNDHEATVLIEELEKKVESLPERVAEYDQKLSKLQDKQRKLLQLKPAQKATDHLKAVEIPKLKNDLTSIEESLDAANEEIAFLEANLQNPQEDLRNAESVQSDVFDIDRYYKEGKQLMRQIEKLKRDLPSATMTRTFDQALAEQQVVQCELSAKRSEKDESEKRQRIYLNRINDLEKKINALVAEQLKIKELVQQEENTKERLQELITLKEVLEVELENLKVTLEPAINKHEDAICKLDSARKRHKVDVQAIEKVKEERSREVDAVENLHESIRKLQSKNLEKTLEEKNAMLKMVEENCHELQNKRESLDAESRTLTTDIDSHKQKGKELHSNLSLIRLRSKGITLKENLKSVERKLGSLEIKGVGAKCDQLAGKISELREKKNELSGNLRGMEENIESRKSELNEGLFKTAEQKYREKLIFLTVQQHAEKDLQKYYNALDVAMQHFHRDRMNSVNTLVRELWRLIYKGNDIDHIEIKTDESSAAVATADTDRRRTYNYRVVQVKSGAEIEMRGRCSAGQKVLASLIIRMALSETFSANCGILTLDEPTTNLDKQNINSLCHAITSIVHEHSQRKNFQLVVITHDQDFLQTMSDADFFSHYWEVSRNKKCKSAIVKKELQS